MTIIEHTYTVTWHKPLQYRLMQTMLTSACKLYIVILGSTDFMARFDICSAETLPWHTLVNVSILLLAYLSRCTSHCVPLNSLSIEVVWPHTCPRPHPHPTSHPYTSHPHHTLHTLPLTSLTPHTHITHPTSHPHTLTSDPHHTPHTLYPRPYIPHTPHLHTTHPTPHTPHHIPHAPRPHAPRPYTLHPHPTHGAWTSDVDHHSLITQTSVRIDFTLDSAEYLFLRCFPSDNVYLTFLSTYCYISSQICLGQAAKWVIYRLWVCRVLVRIIT